MGSSVRSYLMAGVTAIAVSATVIAPSIPTASQAHASDVHVAPQIDLAASVRSVAATPPNPEHFAAAKAAIARIDPVAAATAAATEPALLAAVQAAAPIPLNAASDWIVSSYQFVQSWVTYGVQLANYALQFIPYGYLISAQINIFYYNLILPISDSIVYGLVVPVVNDPLNPASYINGLITVGQASVNAAINTGIAEFNYFFGWLIPPLPPLPLAAARTLQPEGPTTTLAAGVSASATAADVPPTPAADVITEAPVTSRPSASSASSVPEPSATPEPTTTPETTKTPEPPTTESTKTPEPTTAEPTKTPEPPTTTSAGGVQAQGEVRGGGTENTPSASTAPSTTTSGGSDKAVPTQHTDEPSAPEASPGPGADKSGPSEGGSGTSAAS